MVLEIETAAGIAAVTALEVEVVRVVDDDAARTEQMDRFLFSLVFAFFRVDGAADGALVPAEEVPEFIAPDGFSTELGEGAEIVWTTDGYPPTVVNPTGLFIVGEPFPFRGLCELRIV